MDVNLVVSLSPETRELLDGLLRFAYFGLLTVTVAKLFLAMVRR